VSECGNLLTEKKSNCGAGHEDAAGAGSLYCFVTESSKKVTL
jgi:hypothetical protein